MRRLGDRRVDIETDAGPLRIGLWADYWVIAWRRDGAEPAEEVFDVFAPSVDDLVPPLVGLGISGHAARELAMNLLVERAAMEAAGEE